MTPEALLRIRAALLNAAGAFDVLKSLGLYSQLPGYQFCLDSIEAALAELDCRHCGYTETSTERRNRDPGLPGKAWEGITFTVTYDDRKRRGDALGPLLDAVWSKLDRLRQRG